ncbi:hypothetical protein [Lentzea sp. CC55]|uniref:hypothetical protein n=1 Tax=Lentzea sp. CC55 TaxID=2884909 RepID=UPI001F3DAA15|nr:hypothetical protein [Lentzea sp. CC55]MCG8926970.1 hypothetical protein [Lentzea sp. CC55]
MSNEFDGGGRRGFTSGVEQARPQRVVAQQFGTSTRSANTPRRQGRGVLDQTRLETFIPLFDVEQLKLLNVFPNLPARNSCGIRIVLALGERLAGPGDCFPRALAPLLHRPFGIIQFVVRLHDCSVRATISTQIPPLA